MIYRVLHPKAVQDFFHQLVVLLAHFVGPPMISTKKQSSTTAVVLETLSTVTCGWKQLSDVIQILIFI